MKDEEIIEFVEDIQNGETLVGDAIAEIKNMLKKSKQEEQQRILKHLNDTHRLRKDDFVTLIFELNDKRMDHY